MTSQQNEDGKIALCHIEMAIQFARMRSKDACSPFEASSDIGQAMDNKMQEILEFISDYLRPKYE